MSAITFKLTGGTNVGLVRSNNEDNFIVNVDLTQNDWFIPSDTSKDINLGKAGCLMVVADGMGGMNAGEVASAIAINTVKEEFSAKGLMKITKSDEKIKTFMQKVVVKADDNIKKAVDQDSSTSGMGTTIVMAWILGNKAHIVWCGDSRAYLFNANSGLSRLSNDHSYVQQLVDEGKLDPELAFDHPNSNIITRSLGDSHIKARPDYMSRTLSEGDIVFLCSDGLCGLCRDEEILDVINQEVENVEQYKTNLINAALEAGGHDNVTITLFQLTSIVNEENEAAISTDTFNDFSAEKKRKKISKRAYINIALIVLVLAMIALCLGLLHHFDVINLGQANYHK